MLHEPAASSGKDPAWIYKKRIGIRMFIAYAVVYGGFIAINTIFPKLMGKQIIFGLNLAVTYGFGLIILAIVSGIIYNHLCTRMEDKMEGEDDKEGASE